MEEDLDEKDLNDEHVFITMLGQVKFDANEPPNIRAFRWLAQELGPEYRGDENTENIAWKLLDGMAIFIVSIGCTLYIKPSLDYWSPRVVLGIIFAIGGSGSNLGPNIWSSYGITSNLRTQSPEEKIALKDTTSRVKRILYKMLRSIAGLSAALPFTKVGIDTLSKKEWYFVPTIALIEIGNWLLIWFGLENIAASMRIPTTEIKWTDYQKAQIKLIRARIVGMHDVARKLLMNRNLSEREVLLPAYYKLSLTMQEVNELIGTLGDTRTIEKFFPDPYAKKVFCNAIAKLGLKRCYQIKALMNSLSRETKKNKRLQLLDELNRILGFGSDARTTDDEDHYDDDESISLIEKGDHPNSLARQLDDEEKRNIEKLILSVKGFRDFFGELTELMEGEIGIKIYQELLLSVKGSLPEGYQGPPPNHLLHDFLRYSGGAFALAGLAGYGAKAWEIASSLSEWKSAPTVLLAAGAYWGGGIMLTALSCVALGSLVSSAGIKIVDLVIKLAKAAKNGQLNETLSQMLPIKLSPKITSSSLTIAVALGSISWATNVLVNNEAFGFNKALATIMRTIAIIVAVEFNTFAFVVGIIAPMIIVMYRKFASDEDKLDLATLIPKLDSFFKKFNHMPPEQVLKIMDKFSDDALAGYICGDVLELDFEKLLQKAKAEGTAQHSQFWKQQNSTSDDDSDSDHESSLLEKVVISPN